MTHYSKLVEKKIKSKKIYRGVTGFNVDTVRLVNGKTSFREYMLHPGASAVLAFIDGKVLFVEQYRYPVKKVTLELPAGKMKKGQSPLACARAELEEETGYKAGKIKKLLSFNTSVAFSDEVLHIYLAENLKRGKMHLDADEFVNVKLIDYEKALKMVKSGKITDSKTIIALLYYKALCKA
ncbi:NUDIX hydrolase [Candidatus Proelusimicrobium volucris]|uniref:NUDIX hydrolase n=1 Tax=Candidatus Proelusimicrobium volucris TaxID=3416225 RepID=UPI003D0F2865